MDYLKSYMKVERSQFEMHRPNIEWNIFKDLDLQNKHFAHFLSDRIQQVNKNGEKLVIVLPTGPIDYMPFISEINRRHISMNNLYIFMMDEYCMDENTLIDEEHPLSFRKHIKKIFIESVESKLRINPENLIFPDPKDPGDYTKRIDELGGVDITYGGFGLNGHLAFNDPFENKKDFNVSIKDSLTRVVELSRETISQNALGGTRGLLELVPRLAVTIGMKEMLNSKEIHIYLLRKWHSGIMRRCIFGDITEKVPGTYLQQHPKVKIFMPEYVAELPSVNIQLDI